MEDSDGNGSTSAAQPVAGGDSACWCWVASAVSFQEVVSERGASANPALRLSSPR
jgi:hypothetical protein